MGYELIFIEGVWCTCGFVILFTLLLYLLKFSRMREREETSLSHFLFLSSLSRDRDKIVKVTVAFKALSFPSLASPLLLPVDQ